MQTANIVDKALSNVIDDLYTYLKTKASIKIRKADVKRKLPLLSDHMQSVRLVKTLWQIDKAVDVESFYCDSHVLVRTRRGKLRRTKINTASDLGSDPNFVIQGIAGQGKSILLRHMLVNQAALGTHIPVFLELRRIQAGETLLTHISRFLQTLDLPAESRTIQALLTSGKFMFFLDGFDEIADSHVISILNELEHLASISHDCRFIVTSRPNSPVTMSPSFTVVSLDNLRANEYQKLVRKLSDDPIHANAIITAIRARATNISGLLCTPLLVTLLLMAYKSYQTIPIQLSDFYESVFISLLQRHDGTKPAFTRSRRCSLNDNQYRRVFDAFCFESKRQRTTLFTYQQIYSSVEQAMTRLGIKENPDSYINDIRSITCLLLEESHEYRFIHNTVQEYYAASFIRNLPEPSAMRFYNACQDYHTAVTWSQELRFLSEIDKYRYTKYLVLLKCSRAMGYDHQVDHPFVHPPETSLERTRSILGPWALIFTRDEHDALAFAGVFYGIRGLSSAEYDVDTISEDIFTLDYTDVMAAISHGKIAGTRPTHIQVSCDVMQQPQMAPDPNRPTTARFSVDIDRIIDAGLLIPEFTSIAHRCSSHAYGRWQEALSYLDSQDAFISTLDFV